MGADDEVLGVIRSHPGLARLPSGLPALVFGAIFAVSGAMLLARDEGSTGAQVAGGVLISIGAYLASFFGNHFNVAPAAGRSGAQR
jgi:hypothetical protein